MNLPLDRELDPHRRRTLMVEEFQACFGESPSVGACAPGRVDLMGSHTDYNDGLVLTAPINRDTWVMASPAMTRKPNWFR